MAVFNAPNRISGRVLGRGGTRVRGTTITVTKGGTNATLYSDPDLTVTRANPITSSDGDFEFYVPPGTYSLAYTGSDRYTHPNPEEVVVVDPDQAVASDFLGAASATDGQVLTAVGDGTAAWESATIDTVNLVDGSVTTAKLADANVTTAKLADLAVTVAKLVNGTFLNAIATLLLLDENYEPITTEGGQLVLAD